MRQGHWLLSSIKGSGQGCKRIADGGLGKNAPWIRTRGGGRISLMKESSARRRQSIGATVCGVASTITSMLKGGQDESSNDKVRYCGPGY